MIPNLFSKQPIPEKIPKELSDKIKEFSKVKNKDKFVEKCFLYIVGKWYGQRFGVFTRFPRLFEKDIFKIFKTQGYLHCTTINFLLRIMLIKSGLFKEEDIVLKITNTWYIYVHQYLEVKLSKTKTITLDPWNYHYGIPYGNYGKGFASIKMSPDVYKKP
jgi:hypothetical protein